MRQGLRERFLWLLEANDDGGAGDSGDEGGDEGGGGEQFHSIFSQQGWSERSGETPVADPPDGGDQTPPDGAPPEPPAAPEAPEGWDEADWAQFQKEYPGRTPAQLWTEHKNLRTAFSRGEHKNPPPEAPPPPAEEKPPTWTAQDYSALGEIPQDGLTMIQREQLGSLMQADPKAAAHWAAANSHLMTEQEFNAVQSNWWQADPFGAAQAWRQAEELQRQAQQEAEYGPRMQVVDQAQQLHGIALAEQAIPDFAEHKEDFAKWIEENPQIDDHLAALKTPEEVRDALTVVYYQWYGPNLAVRLREAQDERARIQAERAAAAEEAQKAAEQANQRARTATRTAPAPTTGGEASDDDIRAAIRAAHR